MKDTYSHSSAPDPFTTEDGMLKMVGANPGIPVSRQIPKVEQFILCDTEDRIKVNELLARSFKKEVIIWSMPTNWTKEGNFVVVMFYSEIVECVEPNYVSTSSGELRDIAKIPVMDTDDVLFNEFIEKRKKEKEERDAAIAAKKIEDEDFTVIEDNSKIEEEEFVTIEDNSIIEEHV